MSLASNNPFNSRNLRDANYIKSSSLQTSLVTPSLDFIQATPYPTTEQVILQATLGATTTTLANGVTASIAWQDSADNSSFSNITQLGSFAVIGTTTLAATSQQVLLSPSVRRYVRVAATFTDSGSNSTTNYTGSLTASALF